MGTTLCTANDDANDDDVWVDDTGFLRPTAEFHANSHGLMYSHAGMSGSETSTAAACLLACLRLEHGIPPPTCMHVEGGLTTKRASERLTGGDGGGGAYQLIMRCTHDKRRGHERLASRWDEASSGDGSV